VVPPYDMLVFGL